MNVALPKEGATGEVKFVELYDHERDPLETHNLADDPAARETTVDLPAKLRAGFPSLQPDGQHR